MSVLYLSIIIPSYNEEDRIAPTLKKILTFIHQKKYAAEIIVVDDGSQDRTTAIAESELGNFPHKTLVETSNQGKGHAVKRGMLEAKGEYLLFTDADLSTPIEEVDRLVGCLKDGFDIAIGSRGLKDSRVEVHQNIIRETMGKTFNRIARLFTFRQIRDSQCGFKCFRKDVARDLFKSQVLKGFSFDAEIVYLAQKKGYRIAEVPVIWRNSSQSHVRILKDSFQMLVDLIRIRLIHR